MINQASCKGQLVGGLWQSVRGTHRANGERGQGEGVAEDVAHLNALALAIHS